MISNYYYNFITFIASSVSLVRNIKDAGRPIFRANAPYSDRSAVATIFKNITLKIKPYIRL